MGKFEFDFDFVFFGGGDDYGKIIIFCVHMVISVFVN